MNITQKKFISIMLATFLFGASFAQLQAKDITRGEAFEAIGNNITTPDSSQYINLLYKDLKSTDSSFSALQKLVYTGKLANKNKNVYPNSLISKSQLYSLLSYVADKNNESFEYLKGSNETAQAEDIKNLESIFGKAPTITIERSNPKSNIDSTKLQILNDVYDTLEMNHYESNSFKSNQLIDSAIEGLAKGADDVHTSYFPPAKNDSFQTGLEGKYEGIGAYVDMPEPGVVVIVSPITGSPSEKAGMKGGDIIYSVDDRIVEKTDSLTDITTLIKGPAGTTVKLGVLRDGEEIEISVVRGNIVINDIEGKALNSSTYYIQMKMFSGAISKQFTQVLENMPNEKNTNKIIIDLRNNPGGYLDQVVDILGNFIENGKNVAVVKYKESIREYSSYGYTTYDFAGKKIIILINSGTASASEIMAGTLKDYYPDSVTIIGEKSYGKGSVQTQRYYNDGSALKYTVAKWYTGKSENGIDGIGITPDIEVLYDQALWEEKQVDNQLEEALKIK